MVFLDTKTIGDIPNLRRLKQYGQVTYYETTTPEQTLDRVKGADIVITNNTANLINYDRLKQLKNRPC